MLPVPAPPAPRLGGESSDPSLEEGILRLEESLLGIGEKGVRWLSTCEREVLAFELRSAAKGLLLLGRDLAPWRYLPALGAVEDDLRTVSDGLVALSVELDLWSRWMLARVPGPPPLSVRHILLHASSLFQGPSWRGLPGRLRDALVVARTTFPEEGLHAALALRDALGSHLPRLRDGIATLHADLILLHSRHLGELSSRPVPSV